MFESPFWPRILLGNSGPVMLCITVYSTSQGCCMENRMEEERMLLQAALERKQDVNIFNEINESGGAVKLMVFTFKRGRECYPGTF